MYWELEACKVRKKGEKAIWLPTSQVKDLLQERESKQLYLT